MKNQKKKYQKIKNLQLLTSTSKTLIDLQLFIESNWLLTSFLESKGIKGGIQVEGISRLPLEG